MNKKIIIYYIGIMSSCMMTTIHTTTNDSKEFHEKHSLSSHIIQAYLTSGIVGQACKAINDQLPQKTLIHRYIKKIGTFSYSPVQSLMHIFLCGHSLSKNFIAHSIMKEPKEAEGIYYHNQAKKYWFKSCAKTGIFLGLIYGYTEYKKIS